jgi:integrase
VRKDLPDLLRFMLATGVRIGEALAVRWQDVDLASGVVSINGTVVRVKGVGLVRKGTKRETSERLLRLPDWALAMLEGRHADQSPFAAVFPDSLGGWRDRSNVGRDLRKVRKGTAYAWVKSHTARRTVATLLDGEGMSARVIADQLGHARVSMTQDVYMGRRAVAGAAGHLEALDLGRKTTDTAAEEGAR